MSIFKKKNVWKEPTVNDRLVDSLKTLQARYESNYLSLSNLETEHFKKIADLREAYVCQTNDYVVKITSLENQLEAKSQSFNDRVALNKSASEESARLKIETSRKEIRAEVKKELEQLEVEIKAARQETLKAKEAELKSSGLYNGALIVITNLEKQVKAANELTQSLLKALPSVSANIKTVGDNNVNVNK